MSATNYTIHFVYFLIRCIDPAPKTSIDIKQSTRTHAYFKITQFAMVSDFFNDALMTILAKLHFAVSENQLFEVRDFFSKKPKSYSRSAMSNAFVKPTVEHLGSSPCTTR